MAQKKPNKDNGNGAPIGFEAKLCLAADKLRNNLDAAEYKHVVLGLIFLKYTSDAFGEQHAKFLAEHDLGADPEHPDEYRANGIFWVPKEAQSPSLQAAAKQPTIGKLIDDAMVAIERDNKSLKGVVPKAYARPSLGRQRLGELIDPIGAVERSQQDIEHAAPQLVSKAVASEGVIDTFAAKGLKEPDISIRSAEFLADVRDLRQTNLAVELLRKLLNDETKTRSRTNLVQSRSFSEMLEKSIRAYKNPAIETAQIIEELIQLAKDMRDALQRGVDLKLTDDELAFYDAFQTNDAP